MSTIIVQKLKKVVSQDVSLAERYYSLVSALNQLQLTEREIQLMAFMAMSGAEKFDRREFCNAYGTTQATVNNMVAKLRKRNILVKSKNAVIVNPLISLDFSKDIQLEIKLIHGGE